MPHSVKNYVTIKENFTTENMLHKKTWPEQIIVLYCVYYRLHRFQIAKSTELQTSATNGMRHASLSAELY